MDAEFILVSNDTKNSIKKQELAEKSHFQGVLKMGFWQKCKGGTLCKTLDFGQFVRLENGKSAKGVSNDTKNSIK